MVLRFARRLMLIGIRKKVSWRYIERFSSYRVDASFMMTKKGTRKVQEVPQLQTAALPRHQEEEKTDRSKQAQIEQTYEKQ